MATTNPNWLSSQIWFGLVILGAVLALIGWYRYVSVG